VSGPRAPLRLAVTGTDTGVGKTVVSCALLAALRARGLDARAMKPVETGVADRHAGTDAARLHRAAGGAGAPDDVCPATYAEPLAPLVAAERAGRPLDLARLDAAAARLAAGADALVVEGAGGLLVPFAPGLDFAGLAARWALDVVVVAADRLGVLNHALLTVREAERRGLRVCAVALHPLQAGDADLSAASNGAVLGRLLGAVPLVTVPYLDGVAQEDPAALAAAGEALARVLVATP
jgi:dethiobiotin synthetase